MKEVMKKILTDEKSRNKSALNKIAAASVSETSPSWSG